MVKKTKQNPKKAKKAIPNKVEITKKNYNSEVKTETIIRRKDEINIQNESRKQSPHIVNLKNPYQELFDKKFEAKNKLPLPSEESRFFPPKAQRPLPKKNKKIEIDFIPTNQGISKLTTIKNFLSFFSPPITFRKNRVYKEKTSENLSAQPIVEEEIEDIFATPNHFEFSHLYIPKNWYQKIAIFLVIAIVLILPLQAFTYYQNLQNTKDRILLITNEAIDSLKTGSQAINQLDLTAANFKFNEAENNFVLAGKEINAINDLTVEILKLLPGQDKTINVGLTLLDVGKIVAETGQILINSGQDFLNNKSVNSYYNSLVNFQSNLTQAIDNFDQVETKIKTIKLSELPSSHRETLNKVTSYLPEIENGLNYIYSVNKSLLKILGDNQWQRYLVVFLNNNELRGGGGFMGSFAVLDIDQGEIKKLDIPSGGTYAIQGQLVPQVISPEPLHLINSRWEFQDANWWPDFPTTAKKMEWFYQNANGPSVDGVIVITSTLMEKLLDIFGPISMPEYGRQITSENFVMETQKIVELEYDKEKNQPKQFIADLAPKLLEQIFSAKSQKVKELFEVLKTALNQKQLMVYFNDEEIEKIIADFGWAGELKKTDGDYLSVVQSNIAGGKTDGVIKETIEHQAEIQEDGSIIDTIKLIRRHTGIPKENIFTGVQNNSYVRFYVPLGSELLEASGFKSPPKELFEQPKSNYQPDLDLFSIETDHKKDESSGTDIYKENGKTVFGNWLMLKPGEVQETIIKYRLPFNLSLEGKNNFYYSLLIQKQLGSLGSELKSYLKLNNKFKPLAKFPADLSSDNTGVYFNAILTIDQFYGVVLTNS